MSSKSNERRARSGNLCSPSGEATGQSILELTMGVILLVIIALAVVDVIAIVLANSMNDDLVQKAARAAASQTTLEAAQDKVDKIKTQFQASSHGFGTQISDMTVTSFDTEGAAGVEVLSKMTVNLPVPIPFVQGYNTMQFQAAHKEPIVALPVK